MRKLILEGSIDEFRKLDGEPMGIAIQKLKSFEVLRFLRFDPERFAAICRVGFEDPSTRLEDVFNGNQLTVVGLEKERNGTYICFAEEKFNPRSQRLLRTGVYLSEPCEIRDGRVKVGVLGEAKQLRAFTKLAETVGAHLMVASLTEAKFSQPSPLGRLTEKQRTVLVSAFALGYYDMPRRISSRGLAKRLGLRSSTLIEHRRKAERRLLAEILGEETAPHG
jgi:predicted DNA binding protein